MTRAIDSVSDGQTIRGAAKEFGIPYTTLLKKCNGTVGTGLKMGPATLLAASQEEKLVDWVLSCGRNGIPVKRELLISSVAELFMDRPEENPFKNGRPGRKWLNLFLKRHPQISERIPESINKARALVTPERIRNWFRYVRDHLEEEEVLDILEDPSRIFNADETGFQSCPKTGKVLGPKGLKNFYEVKIGNEKESVTVMCAFSAIGLTVPPMIVYPLKRISQAIAMNLNPEWGIGRSENGWMTSGLYFEYISNIFYPWLIRNNVQLPVVLFVDGHRSHISYHVSQYCKDHGIFHIALTPNATHILQPADVSVFKPLKVRWRDVVYNWKIQNPNKSVTREMFGNLLQHALDDGVTEDIIRNGFKRCGLFPFDADAVDYTKCMSTRDEVVLPRKNCQSVQT